MLLVLLFTVALTVRTFWTYDQVFVAAGTDVAGEEADYVRFRGTDAWYRLRLVEGLLADFPHPIRFDPYLRHPGGEPVAEAPLFDYMLALPAWIAGGGRPTTKLIETVAAWLPAILGALVTIPVYFLAHTLWGRPAGLIAAAVIAVLPGRFLDRSLLGAADHHVAEVWWSTCCLLFLVLALEERQRPRETDGEASWLSVYPVAAGLTLAAYLLTWRSASALPCLFLGWAAVQWLADLYHGRSSAYLAKILIPATATALLAIAPWLDGTRVPYRHAVVLAMALLAFAGLAALSAWRDRRRPSPLFVAAAAAALGIAGAAVGALVFRDQLADLVELFQRLAPTAWATTVAEMRPLHLDDSLAQALWREFTTAAVTAACGLALLLWRSWRHGRPTDLLLSAWSVAMLAASLGQRRFTYYLAVAVALLSAAAVVWTLSSVFRRRGRSLALAAIAAALLIPNLRAAAVRASRPSGPDPAWHAAAVWLRSHTPEPFGDAEYYYARYQAGAVGGPRADYGVMAWWDRGFWLLRTARRVPVANPKGHGILTAASFYLEQRQDEALRILAEAGARYVVVDSDMPIRQAGGSEIGLGTVASMATWLGQPVERYVERYELRSSDGSWRPIFLYQPDYFRTMAVRLQTFGGQAVTPRDSLWVVAFRAERRRDGAVVKRITDLKPFTSHRQAADYLAGQRGDRHRLVSTDPGASCVPLAALDGFRRVYPDRDSAAEVQIFEVRSSLPVEADSSSDSQGPS